MKGQDTGTLVPGSWNETLNDENQTALLGTAVRGLQVNPTSSNVTCLVAL